MLNKNVPLDIRKKKHCGKAKHNVRYMTKIRETGHPQMRTGSQDICHKQENTLDLDACQAY